MKTTLSVIKADIGSIGGHLAPSRQLIEQAGEVVSAALDKRFVIRAEQAAAA